MDSIESKNISLEAAEKFGEIKNKLRSDGNIIDDFDLLIAAICLVEDAILVTENGKHFNRIENLEVESWK